MRYYKTKGGYFYKETNKGLNKTRISKKKYDLHQKKQKGGQKYHLSKNTELYTVKNNRIYPIFLCNNNRNIKVKPYIHPSPSPGPSSSGPSSLGPYNDEYQEILNTNELVQEIRKTSENYLTTNQKILVKTNDLKLYKTKYRKRKRKRRNKTQNNFNSRLSNDHYTSEHRIQEQACRILKNDFNDIELSNNDKNSILENIEGINSIYKIDLIKLIDKKVKKKLKEKDNIYLDKYKTELRKLKELNREVKVRIYINAHGESLYESEIDIPDNIRYITPVSSNRSGYKYSVELFELLDMILKDLYNKNNKLINIRSLYTITKDGEKTQGALKLYTNKTTATCIEFNEISFQYQGLYIKIDDEDITFNQFTDSGKLWRGKKKNRIKKNEFNDYLEENNILFIPFDILRQLYPNFFNKNSDLYSADIDLRRLFDLILEICPNNFIDILSDVCRNYEDDNDLLKQYINESFNISKEPNNSSKKPNNSSKEPNNVSKKRSYKQESITKNWLKKRDNRKKIINELNRLGIRYNDILRRGQRKTKDKINLNLIEYDRITKKLYDRLIFELYYEGYKIALNEEPEEGLMY
tara:strand:+ start:411 stop:2153 length:1743 start_codon:yes stop_codon:yes gene_type:complete